MSTKSNDLAVNKAAINLIHADGFFKPGEAEACWAVVATLPFVQKDYGLEIENFTLVLPGIDPIFSKMLGEEVVVDRKSSGVFRKPMNIVHFESFESPNEWCFLIALEKTTFNIYHHISNPGFGDAGTVDARHALEGWKFNYRNIFEWKIVTNIVLEPNQGIFFRPWCFHSCEDGVVQYYRLLPKDPT